MSDEQHPPNARLRLEFLEDRTLPGGLDLAEPPRPGFRRITVDHATGQLYAQVRQADDRWSRAEPVGVIRGVVWEPHTRGAPLETLHLEVFNSYRTAFGQLKQLGANAVRLHHDLGTGPKAAAVLDAAADAGLGVVIQVDSPRHGVVGDVANAERVVPFYRPHPAVLGYVVGPPEPNFNRFYGRFATAAEAAAAVEEIASRVKRLDPDRPVFATLADVALDLEGSKDFVRRMPSVDVIGLNAYRGDSFHGLFDLWEEHFDRPMVVTEYGRSSTAAGSDEESQAATVAALAREIDRAFAAGQTGGGFVHELTPEWWKLDDPLFIAYGTAEAEPGFSLIGAAGVPKLAYERLRSIWREDPQSRDIQVAGRATSSGHGAADGPGTAAADTVSAEGTTVAAWRFPQPLDSVTPESAARQGQRNGAWPTLTWGDLPHASSLTLQAAPPSGRFWRSPGPKPVPASTTADVSTRGAGPDAEGTGQAQSTPAGEPVLRRPLAPRTSSARIGPGVRLAAADGPVTMRPQSEDARADTQAVPRAHTAMGGDRSLLLQETGPRGWVHGQTTAPSVLTHALLLGRFESLAPEPSGNNPRRRMPARNRRKPTTRETLPEPLIATEGDPCGPSLPASLLEASGPIPLRPDPGWYQDWLERDGVPTGDSDQPDGPRTVDLPFQPPGEHQLISHQGSQADCVCATVSCRMTSPEAWTQAVVLRGDDGPGLQRHHTPTAPITAFSVNETRYPDAVPRVFA